MTIAGAHSPIASAEGIMPTPAVAIPIRQWTLDELDRLPDDGNTYELVHGELFVTPPPATDHEDVMERR